MKKIFLAIALCVSPALVVAAQTPTTTIDKFNSSTTSIDNLRVATNTKLGVIEANRLDHETRVAAAETGKAAVSCFADSTAFNACFALDWPTGFDTAGDYIVTGEWDFTGATVTGISSGGISHAASDGAYYASRNGAWASLTGVFAAPLGTDDNYVTDAEKIKLGSLSGTNTGDQDLSGYALTSSVLSKTNTTAFTPTGDYHPVPKKYVDDEITATMGAGPTLSVSSPLDLNETTGVLSITANSYQAYDADLTTWAGVTPGTGVAAFIATPSSANFATAITGDTGTGGIVFDTSPTITTPSVIGATYPVGGSATTPTGNINIDGVSADHYYFKDTAANATYTLVVTSPPAAGEERGVIVTIGGDTTYTATLANSGITWLSGTAPTVLATTTSKRLSFFCFVLASGNPLCGPVAGGGLHD